MKKPKIVRVLNILILTCLLVTFPIKVTLAKPKEYSLGNIAYTRYQKINDDIVFKGVFSSHSIYFNVDEWINVDSMESEINLNINQLVSNSKESYITFSLNGVPFYSTQLIYDASQETKNIKLKVPLDNLKEGFNEFKIDGYCRISDKPCTDDVNNANWLVIKKDSSININYREILADNKIMNFPYPFVKTSEAKNKTEIVLSDDYTDNDLQKVLLISSYLGNKNSYDYNIEIKKYSDVNKENNSNNVIYISSKESIPSEILTLFKDISSMDLSNSAVIRIGDSPYGNGGEGNKIMLVTSDNETYSLKAINFLANKELTSQISSDIFIVDEKVDEKVKMEEAQKVVSFKDMGINELQFKGAFRRESVISYAIPKNKVIASGGKIKLNFRYSENLDFNKSLLTVYINNTPIGSKKLEKENALNNELELSIPRDIINSNYIEIKLAFDLELIDTYCERREEEMPWAVIDGNSYIHYETQNYNGYFFNKYPSPFIVDNRFNDVILSVPDKLSSKELTALGNVFEVIGKEVSSNLGSFEVSRYDNLNGKEKEKNIIVYGTPENNELVKNLNDSLWFKYNDKYSGFIGNEKLFLTEDFNSNIATFQLDISPYNKQRAILVLTSPKEDILLNSLSYLGNSSEINKLKGDSGIIDEYGDLRTFAFKGEIETPIYEKVKQIDSSSKVIIIILAGILIFFIVSIIMYYMKNKNGKKSNKLRISRFKK